MSDQNRAARLACSKSFFLWSALAPDRDSEFRHSEFTDITETEYHRWKRLSSLMSEIKGFDELASSHPFVNTVRNHPGEYLCCYFVFGLQTGTDIPRLKRWIKLIARYMEFEFTEGEMISL